MFITGHDGSVRRGGRSIDPVLVVTTLVMSVRGTG
jgi:hypothetical protein